MPAEGMAIDDYLRLRFGEPDALQPAMAELTRQGKDEGLNFRFDRIERIPNTLDAHRLMHLSGTSGHDSSEVARDLLRSFFEEGRNISDRAVLADIAIRHGISKSEFFETLESDASSKVVLSQESQVRGSGVTGVPDFLVNRRLFVVGAQSTGSLVSVFDRAMFGAESDQPVSETLQ
jgi:predicted DsbA family dithiol-disulfide isomerase